MPRAGRSRSRRSRSPTRTSASRPPTAASWPPGTCPRPTAPPCCVSHGSGGSRKRVMAPTSGCSRATATACSRSTTPATGTARGTRTASATTPSPASTRRWTTSPAGPTSTRGRIAGVGLSLGGEVLLEATARDQRLRAVVSDGAARPVDSRERQRRGARRAHRRHARDAGRARHLGHAAGAVAVRVDAADRSATGAADRRRRRPDEIPTNEAYRDAGGANVALWTLPNAGHTAGLAHLPRGRTSGG